MRLLIQHRSRYHYPRPALLGPQVIRLRPADHARARIESYTLSIEPEHRLHWQRDPHGNHVARATFKAGQATSTLDMIVEMTVDIAPINPFDFFVDDRAKTMPFTYPERLDAELAPYLDTGDPAYRMGRKATELLQELPWSGDTIDVLIKLNSAVRERIAYVIRDESGVWTPEETLVNGRGSCRDVAVLLIALMRSRGIAARFASGYLVQLADEGMIPDEPKGVDRDVVDLHAWAEAYVPGAGWIGFDATSGLLCGEGHIALACTATPSHAAPLDGTSDVGANDVQFSTMIARLGHEARPTTPYTDDVWNELVAGGDRADAALQAKGMHVWIGGEPTFVAREGQARDEWQGGALGPDKWARGQRLASLLKERLAPGGVVLHRTGKAYPGESLPRWALDVIGRRDEAAIWSGGYRDGGNAQEVLAAIASELGVAAQLHPAYEDPWEVIRDEARLPANIDPRTAGLDDPEERRRLARIMDQGVGSPVAWVLPLARAARGNRNNQPADRNERTDQPPANQNHQAHRTADPTRALYRADDSRPASNTNMSMPVPTPVGSNQAASNPAASSLPFDKAANDPGWLTERWQLRREHLFLLPGDSPAGLRLPLGSVIGGAPPVTWADAPDLPDPRRDAPDEAQGVHSTRPAQAARVAHHEPGIGLRTAIVVEKRGDQLWVFVPPMPRFDDFCTLVRAIDRVQERLGCELHLEGYPPPPSGEMKRFSVTPDPGVLEVNLPPVTSSREAIELHQVVFDAALASGLTAERYLLDGRAAGSGGGNHITIGGPRPEASPWLQNPALLASLIAFVQHHPSLSYMFSGLFVGPTSQAPRIDEARHDALYELELALPRLHEPGVPAWQVDALLRHLLVDVAGSTHRAEICVDKLFDPQTPYGRQGLVELRAFEMPPHPRMVAAQAILVRSLVAAFAAEPYTHELVRWGTRLHDRFLLPYWLWKDFEDVLGFLRARGVALPADAFRPFIELRCPHVGTLGLDGGKVEVRNAIEPWHVLGEEASQAGTARYVDSSVERLELRAIGLPHERYVVCVNGAVVPMREASRDVRVGGVRFRAWCPPHSLQPHVGIHHPLRIDVVDTWAKRAVTGGAYHVWHPEGRAFDAAPLTRVEAAARRAQRFTLEGPTPWPLRAKISEPHPEQPYTLDLRRIDAGKPMPRAEDWITE